MFNGAYTALITPFLNGETGGEIDEKAIVKIVNWQIEQGINGLVPMGTTGETPTVSHKEHAKVIEICIKAANGRVPVIAGAGSNSTSEAVEMVKFAQSAGANGVLCVAPYYNKPNQAGLFAHFSAIASATDLPVILYNIPGRSIVDISIDTMAKLRAAHKNITGVKDATADMSRVSMQRLTLGEDFNQLSADDMSAVGFNAHGGHGCISVVSNVAPKLFADLQTASLNGNFKEALRIQDLLAPLMEALFIEPNPAGAKYALEKLGFCNSFARLPMVELNDKTKIIIDEAMKRAGLI